MLSPEQREARRTGIGASEIAAVCGLSPWRTPLDVWMSKTSEDEPELTGEDIERGNMLEPSLLRWVGERLARDYGYDVRANALCCRLACHRYAIATPDGFAFDAATCCEPRAVVEVKSPRRARGWVDPEVDALGCPEIYRIQVQWQMLVTSLPTAFLGALIYGSLWIYRIDAAPDLQAALLEAAGRFWRDHVETCVPPPVSAGDTSSSLARYMPQRSTGLLAVPEAEASEIVEALRAMQAAGKIKKEAEAKENEIKARICQRIGEAEGLDLGGGATATWKQARASRRIGWEDIARALGATDELIVAHTKEIPGSRRFLVRGVGGNDE